MTTDDPFDPSKTPPRPWYCHRCRAPASCDEDHKRGLCAGCSANDRQHRERARAERAKVLREQPKRRRRAS